MHAALTPTKPLTPEEGGIQFILEIPASDLLFRIAHADDEYQFQVWASDASELHFACGPTRSYPVAVGQLLQQIAIDELDDRHPQDSDYAHSKVVLTMFEDMLNNKLR